MQFFVVLMGAIQLALLIYVLLLATRFVTAHERIASSMDHNARQRDAPARPPE